MDKHYIRLVDVAIGTRLPYTLFIICSLLLGGHSLNAQDFSWDGGGDGTSWEDPLNWDPNGTPGISDQVFINTTSTITISSDVEIADLSISNRPGELLIGSTASLTTNDGVNGYGIQLMGGGFRLENSGDLTVQNAPFDGVVVLGEAQLINEGNLVITQVGENGMSIDGSAFDVFLFQNKSVSTIDHCGLAAITVQTQDMASALFINEDRIEMDTTDGGFYAITIENSFIQFINEAESEWIINAYEMTQNQRAILAVGQVDFVNSDCALIEIDESGSGGIDLQDGSTFENNGLILTTENIHFPLTSGSVFDNADGRVVLLNSLNASFAFPVSIPNPLGAPNDTDGIIDGVASSLEEAGVIKIVEENQVFIDPIVQCESSEDLILIVEGASPDGEYLWNTGVTSTTLNIPNVSSNSGKYSVTISEDNCPDFEAFVNVSILDTPPATGSGSVTLVYCDGDLGANRQVEVDVTDPVIQTVEWMLTSAPVAGAVTSFFTISGAQNEFAEANLAIPVGTYLLSAQTIATNGCQSNETADFSITVNAVPGGTLSTVASAYCMEQNAFDLIFTASAGTAPFTLQLNSDDGDGTFTDDFVVNNVQSGVPFTVSSNLLDGNGGIGSLTIRLEQVTDVSGCIPDVPSQDVPIQIQPAIVDAAFVPFDPALCEGEDLNFSVSVIDLGSGLQNPPNGYTYAWSLNDSNLGSLSDENTISPTFMSASLTSNATVIATVTISDPSSACTASFPYEIDLFANPDLQASDLTTCTTLAQNIDLTSVDNITTSVSSTLAFFEDDPDNGGVAINDPLTLENEEEDYDLADFIENGGTLYVQATNGTCVEAIPITVQIDDPTGTIAVLDATQCQDDDRFTFDFLGSGGTPPYEISILETSATTQTITVSNLSATDEFDILYSALGDDSVGDFLVQATSITDANGCIMNLNDDPI